jgi:hypothetical protein
MMKTTAWTKQAARWLLGRSQARTQGCGVRGCQEQPTLAVAGDEVGTTVMCVRHALAWSESNLCRDIAQHDSGASPRALSAWIRITQDEAAPANCA